MDCGHPPCMRPQERRSGPIVQDGPFVMVHGHPKVIIKSIRSSTNDAHHHTSSSRSGRNRRVRSSRGTESAIRVDDPTRTKEVEETGDAGRLVRRVQTYRT